MKRILAQTGITLFVLASALLIYALLGIANDSLLFTPMTVFPLFVSTALIAIRYKLPYSLLLFALTPALMFFIKGLSPDPTDTRFFLLLVITFDLLFFLVATRITKAFLHHETILTAVGYLAGKLMTYLILMYGIVPLLPLLSYRTVLQNYLWGSPLYSLASFACYVAITLLVLRRVWKGDEKHA